MDIFNRQGFIVQMEWIKCSDRIPEIGKTCLLYITYPEGTTIRAIATPLERSNIRIGGRMYNGDFTTIEEQFDYKKLHNVTHWMPLPDAPKE